jgi:subfamily B ATP-binding cassette protein MsbA
MALQTAWNGFLNNYGALEGMKNFTRELEAGREETGQVKIDRFSSNLLLKDVSFYFENNCILKEITLTVEKNETVAIVGESGSGKTSLVNILSGLVKVDSGLFAIDGIDSRDLDLNSYRRRVGYITQDPVIFSDSIYNNVTLWAEDTPENKAKFWEVLEKASIDSFIRGLPKQENALLGNNGIQISGGQKQRLSIARELFKDIDVLILDEATSSLDSETELSIQDNLARLKGKYTILTIAHRLSTIKDSDKIILMQKGRIEAMGDFNSLKKESKMFERAVAIQNT